MKFFNCLLLVNVTFTFRIREPIHKHQPLNIYQLESNIGAVRLKPQLELTFSRINVFFMNVLFRTEMQQRFRARGYVKMSLIAAFARLEYRFSCVPFPLLLFRAAYVNDSKDL